MVAASAGSPKFPNVLVVVIDTLRADYLKCYGYPRDTSPNIDALASEGTLFEQCYAAGSWTPPSHASMLSGQPVHVHRCDNTIMDDKVPVLPEAMTKLGYRTAAFTANQGRFSRRQGFGRGFQRFEDDFLRVDQWFTKTVFGHLLIEPILSRWCASGDSWRRVDGGDVNRRYLHWLDAGSHHPSFAMLNYMEVHSPYSAPSVFEVASRAMRILRIRETLTGRGLAMKPISSRGETAMPVALRMRTTAWAGSSAA